MANDFDKKENTGNFTINADENNPWSNEIPGVTRLLSRNPPQKKAADIKKAEIKAPEQDAKISLDLEAPVTPLKNISAKTKTPAPAPTPVPASAAKLPTLESLGVQCEHHFIQSGNSYTYSTTRTGQNLKPWQTAVLSKMEFELSAFKETSNFQEFNAYNLVMNEIFANEKPSFIQIVRSANNQKITVLLSTQSLAQKKDIVLSILNNDAGSDEGGPLELDFAA